MSIIPGTTSPRTTTTPHLRSAAQRLGHALTLASEADSAVEIPVASTTLARDGRITAETAPSMADPARIVATVGANPVATARLLNEVRPAAPGATVVPLRRRPGRHVLAALGLALAITTGATALPGGVQQAQALAVPLVTPPLTVTVSGPTTRIGLDVVSTAAMTRDGGHGVWLQLGRARLVGTGSGTGAALVHVGGTVPSSALTPGAGRATLTDLGDGRVTTVAVRVLRQSRVTIDPAVAVPGKILVTGRAAHYDIPSNGYKGDQQSTVQVQVLRAGRWVVAATAPTALDGSVFALVPVPAGRQQVRLVRLQGLNVTGGTSVVRTVTVPKV